MLTSAGERFTLLVVGFVFVACIATLGGLLFTKASAADGVLDVSWTAPTTNANGGPLTDLASYRVYYGTTDPPCPGGPFLAVASSAARPAPHQRVSERLTGLVIGQRYFWGITAGNSRGMWSGCSSTANALARRP